MIPLLIIEGTDRLGKNLLISKLCSQAENHVVRHFGTAKGDDDFEKRTNQYHFFKKEFDLMNKRSLFEMSDKTRYPHDIWIMNRSHIGEAVYGAIYRDTKPNDWIFKMEKDYSFDIDPSIYLLLLTAPAEFVCKRDDGLSFTTDINKKNMEIQFFRDAFDKSCIINKKTVNVSKEDSYRPADDIFNEVNDWIWPHKK